MRAGKVMAKLHVSRQTLLRWRRSGYLKAKRLPTGQFDYDEESVDSINAKDAARRSTLVYAWATPADGMDVLTRRISKARGKAAAANFNHVKVFSDISYSFSQKTNPGFYKVLDLVLSWKAKRVLATKDSIPDWDVKEVLGFICEKMKTELIWL